MSELNEFMSALNRFTRKPGKFMSGLKKFMSEPNRFNKNLNPSALAHERAGRRRVPYVSIEARQRAGDPGSPPAPACGAKSDTSRTLREHLADPSPDHAPLP